MTRCYADVIEWGLCLGRAEYALTVRCSELTLLLCREHTAEYRRDWPEDIVEVRSMERVHA